ncbi:hypothetical protein [Actinoplanes sp. L3-i22]|uniref:hypothetical protein n=1 Tax=Actinoplanes sp. L3-i22 TaxID=2836373 RepID=UPI001C8621BD|nr:hypothetical protein [Actinoplanes sp. L3-i22]
MPLNSAIASYGAVLVLAGGLLGVLLLISFGIWAKRSGKPLRPIALSFSMNLALLLNAEGMWVIATEQLHLPKVFAVLVFAVFEICFLTATSLAAEQYRNTSVYDEDGKIVTPGHPGPMLWIAALIAAVSGIIVASNAVTGTEKLLRLAVPCVIFLMWWAALTAAGQRVRHGRFAYSPRRLAERWGWLIPDDDPDLERMANERQMRRMVVNHHRVSSGRWPKSWWRSRLLKDVQIVGEPVVEDVLAQLARIQQVVSLLEPGGVAAALQRAQSRAPSTKQPVSAAGGPYLAPVSGGGSDPRVPQPPVLRGRHRAIAGSAGTASIAIAAGNVPAASSEPIQQVRTVRMPGYSPARARTVEPAPSEAGSTVMTMAPARSASSMASEPIEGRDEPAAHGSSASASVLSQARRSTTVPESAVAALMAHRDRVTAVVRSGEMDAKSEKWKRADARELCRAARAAQVRLLGTELGALYGKNPRWGQRRIADVS